MTQVALMIASGDLTRRIQRVKNDELGVLAKTFNSMADKLIRANELLDMRVKDKTRELAIANESLAIAKDECLIQIAMTLSKRIKRDNDLVARYGGEEFVVLLPETSYQDCEKIANYIVNSFSRELIVHPASPVASHVTVSIGFGTHIGFNNQNSQEFFKKVDAALYQAKQGGRNQAKSIATYNW